jgi:thiol-disulfide isomerase/thioredoxin
MAPVARHKREVAMVVCAATGYARRMNRLALAIATVAMGCGAKDTGKSPARAVERPAGADSGEGDAAAFVETPRNALVGHRAPAVALELLDGTPVDLAQVLGRRPIYLKFWATWCVPCREQMPHLEATFRAHGDQLAVFAVDVGVNDPIENVREWVASKQLAVPVAVDRDGSVAEQFRLNVTPQHVVIDRAGVVRYIGHRVTPELERVIAAVVEPAAAGAAISDPAVAAPPPPLPGLVLDDGSTFVLDARPRTPLAMTFATLFCDTYIAESRPAIGAACAAHARQIEQVRRTRPELTWITVAYPVWTASEDIRDYRQRLGATTPIGIDRGNAWFRRFGVRNTYTTIVLDGSGAELGRVDGDGAGLAALIARVR